MCASDRRDSSVVPESRKPGGGAGAEAGDERKTSAVAGRRRRRPGRLEAGPFAADVASFGLHLAAENKAAGTIRIYTEAPLWFAAAYLLRETGKTRWGQVDSQDVQWWVVWLLGSYSERTPSSSTGRCGSSSGGCRPRRRFPIRWPGSARPVGEKPVPFFTSVELSRLERACRGNTFAQRRDAAIVSVFRATGIRLAELAGIRYRPG